MKIWMKKVIKGSQVKYLACRIFCCKPSQPIQTPNWESIASKGRHQNTSVETGDFLQENVKCMLAEICRSVTPSPHVRVKGHLGDDSQLLLYYT